MVPRLLFLHVCVCLCAWLTTHEAAWALGGSGFGGYDPARVTAHLYVNSATGSDANAGTSAAPYKTLAKGLWRARQFNDANQGVTVHLAPGEYLEGTAGSNEAAIYFATTTDAPLVIEGQGWNPGVNTGDVILTGSEVMTGWTDEGNKTFSRPWPYQMKIEPPEAFGTSDPDLVPEALRLHSGLFVDMVPYYIVRGANDPDMARLDSTEGCYWIDLGPDGVRGGGDDRLFVKLPATTAITDLNAQSVRVTTRGVLLHYWRNGTTEATIPSAVVIRNLVVRHAGATGIILQNHNGALVEDCVFYDNKLRGLTVDTQTLRSAGNSTVRRCEFYGNGEQTTGGRGKNMLWEDLYIHHNSRQSFILRYTGWGVGAFKIGESSDVTFRRIRSLNNWGLGAWFDTAILRTEIVDSVIANNTNTGIFIENNNSYTIPNLGSETTVEVRNCAILNNNKPAGESGTTPGIQVGESENAVVRDSLIAGNDSQLRFLSLLDRGPMRNNQYFNNTIAATNAAQSLLTTLFGVSGWRTWFDTLNATTDRNAYFHSTSAIFYDRVYNSDNRLSFSSWKSAHTGNIYNTSTNKAVDANSTFAASLYTIKPLVAVTPLLAYLSESAGTVNAFRFTRLATDVSAPLTVTYTVRNNAGDAINGTDVTTLSGNITIPAGSLYADLAVIPITGDGAEPLEPLHLTLGANSAYQRGASEAEVMIDDENGSLPGIAVTATRPSVGEGSGSTGQWTFTRTGAALPALTVNFTISATATSGSDFAPLTGSVTFPAGSATATLELVALNDATPELSESVTITITPQSGVYGVVAGQGTATVTIADDDILSVAAINQSIASGGSPVTVPVTIYNPGDTSANFTISPPDQPYTWGASSLLTAPDYEWVEIVDNPNPSENGTVIPGPGPYVSYDNPSGFTDGMFTWMVGGYSGGPGYSGGWYRNPLPNTTGEATRGSATLPLGFTFPFYGQNYSTLYLNTNGFLAVVDDPAGYEWKSFYNRVTPKRWLNTSRGLPSSDEATYPTPRGAIAGFWEDMTFLQNESKIAYKALPGMFVVTYQNMGYRNESSPYASRFTFQMIVHSNGDIDYQYKRVDRPFGGNPGTVGITNPDISKNLLVSYKDGLVTANQRIRIKHQPTWASVSAKPVTIPAGGSATVNITLDPANLSDGIHTLTIPITSSNPLQPAIVLPVSLGVGDLAGTLQFTAATAQLAEDGGSATVSVSRLHGFSGAVTVGYRIAAGGTASAGVDFTPVSGTLAWADGDFAMKTITIPILDDYDSEGDETLTVELHDPSGGATLGSPAATTVTIQDNDLPVGPAPTLSVTPATAQQINLSWTSVSNALCYRIERSTDGGSTWQCLAPAVASTTFSYSDVGLTPGTTYHYRIQAFNAVSATAWVTANATTHPPGELAILFAAPSVYENAGTLNATVTRSGSTTQAVTVNLSSNNARATVPATVVIPAGQTSANFPVTLVNDATPQGADAQVIISASVPGTFARESFAYAENSLMNGTNGGEGWTIPWADIQSPVDFLIKANGLTYPGWGGAGNYTEGSANGNDAVAYRDLATVRNSGVFYFGVLMQLKPGTYPSDMIVGLDSGSQTNVKNWMKLRFKLQANGSLVFHREGYNSDNWTATGLFAGANNQGVNLLIVKFDFGANNAPYGGDDSFTFWLNPTLDGSGNEPLGGVTITTSLFSTSRVGISGWYKDARFDEIRLATTFAGLTGSAAAGQGQFTLRDDDALSGMAAWRDAEFGSPSESGDAAPLADPDADGLPNLLEYALVGNPHAADGNGVSTGTSGDYLTLTFTHPTGMDDVVLELEASNDLVTWTRIWTSAAGANALRLSSLNNGDGTTTTTVRDTEPLTNSPRRFLRLRALPAQ